jgi:hypothetical protein
MTYFNTLLMPPIVALRILRPLASAAAESDATLPKATVNAVLREVFAIERFLVPRASLPFGVSILAVLTHDTVERRH